MVTDSRKKDVDEPDAFKNLLARLKESQHMHMISDATEKSSSNMAEDVKER